MHLVGEGMRQNNFEIQVLSNPLSQGAEVPRYLLYMNYGCTKRGVEFIAVILLDGHDMICIIFNVYSAIDLVKCSTHLSVPLAYQICYFFSPCLVWLGWHLFKLGWCSCSPLSQRATKRAPPFPASGIQHPKPPPFPQPRKPSVKITRASHFPKRCIQNVGFPLVFGRIGFFFDCV